MRIDTSGLVLCGHDSSIRHSDGYIPAFDRKGLNRGTHTQRVPESTFETGEERERAHILPGPSWMLHPASFGISIHSTANM